MDDVDSGCNQVNDVVRSDAMHALAALALVTALNKTPAVVTLADKAIVCEPNSDVSNSGCGNNGSGNSGFHNIGNGNSGSRNIGNGNSGHDNVGDGNSGCGNTGIANSGGSNVGVGLSGGSGCNPSTPPPTTPPTTPPVIVIPGETGIPGAPVPTATESATLPLTGSSTAGPLALATGLLMSGMAAVTLANRRRRLLVVAPTGGRSEPLSVALGLLLSGKSTGTDRSDDAPSS
jgi:LPXTG-motif cell wall-anchored protein